MENSKVSRPLLPSALRTATTPTAAFVETSHLCIRLYLNVTAASGSGGLQPQIRGYDRISGNAVAVSTGGAAVTATGLFVYELMPSANAAAGQVKESLGRYLPYKWDVNVVHGDGSNYTYSLSAELIPG